jgi:hypothetical protein
VSAAPLVDLDESPPTTKREDSAPERSGAGRGAVVR